MELLDFSRVFKDCSLIGNELFTAMLKLINRVLINENKDVSLQRYLISSKSKL